MDGSRIDDLAYMAKHQINRSDLSADLARIFNEMIFVSGFVHVDPHGGNLKVRASLPSKNAAHKNYEIVLLDHGLYREIPPDYQ